jgi:hypothetical protein
LHIRIYEVNKKTGNARVNTARSEVFVFGKASGGGHGRELPTQNQELV